MISPLLEDKKIQLIFSGKAHPLDDLGKSIVSNLVKMTRKYPNAVVFLEDYDMEIGAVLTSGSDVWLNNPRRPKEASGTSGMKRAKRRLKTSNIAVIVENDPALASRILKLANSAYYSFGRRFGNVRQAIVRMGFEELNN